MSYLAKLLIPEERVVHQTRRSIFVTFGGLALVTLLLVALGAAVIFWGGKAGADYVAAVRWIGVAVALASLPWLLWRIVWWRHKIYVVTTRRVLKLEGILSKDHRDAALDKINDMMLTQTLGGRLLGYGDLQISTANETSGLTFHSIHDPVTFKRQALAQREHAGISMTAPSSADPIAQLERLGELRAKNVISEEEFQAKKAELMKRV